MGRGRMAIVAVAILLGTSVWLQAARADPERDRADELLIEANRLAAAGQLEQAIAKFKQAEKHAPHAKHACNIGVAYALREAWPQALRFLTECRSRWSTDSPRPLPVRLDLDARIDEASRKLRSGNFVAVRVSSVPTGATVWVSAYARDETVTTPATVWLAYGTHVVHAALAGHEPYEKSISVGAGGADELSITLTKQVVTRPMQQPLPLPPPPGAHTRDQLRRSALPSLVVTGLGAALLVNGTIFHIVAAGTKRHAETLRPGAEFDSELSTFRKHKYTALVSYSLGAVVTGIGLYLLHRVRRRNAESRVRLGLHAAGGGGVISVRWDN